MENVNLREGGVFFLKRTLYSKIYIRPFSTSHFVVVFTFADDSYNFIVRFHFLESLPERPYKLA